MTLNNRQATIRVGTDIPVATSKVTGGAGSGRVAFSFQYIPTGILLNVRPRLSDDGNNPLSFFERNPGKALALTFRFGRNATRGADMFTEPIPDVRIVDCANREEWRDTLWKMNQPIGGVPRHTILLKDVSDLKRLQTAVATQNTILNNGGTGAMVFDNWLPGRMLHLQEVSPAWERVLQAPIAQYFFIGEFFTLHFMREHEAAINALDAALRAPANAGLAEGIALP
jgi:hypothetical protein